MAVLALVALAGCSAGEDAVRGAVDAAGQEARDAAGQVATDAVRSRICQVVADGRISEAELAVLRTAVAGAEGAGLPERLTSAVREVVGSAGEPSDGAVQRLGEACTGDQPAQ
jgi:hypothetical protein